ncbi:MAG: polyphenol oxidase family protein [Spirochaetaceae bacterium]|nr:polyphenol oxidase family protein [Spirochaetaceae bacterium]
MACIEARKGPIPAATYMRFSFLFNGRELDDVPCALSLHRAGSMAVTDTALNAERNALLLQLDLTPQAFFACRQTHSRVVQCPDPDGRRQLYDADGLAGRAPALLSVTVADCLPVFLYDTVHHVYAVCHSGWKGTGIAINALSVMNKQYGTRPRDVAALLGPCLQRCCFRVDKERAMIYQNEFGCLGGEYPVGKPVYELCNEQGEQEYYLDMQAANIKLLVDSGVMNIVYHTNCTYMSDNLGSFRREGTHFTKMMALIGGIYGGRPNG